MENNFWSKLKNKSNKSTYDLAKETNIPEEKLDEVFKGERELPTNHVDKVYMALKEKKQPIASIERALMEKFFIDNSILDLRKKWGYSTMEDMAHEIGISRATLYNLRPKYINTVKNNNLQKAYDFFQDGLNKKVKKKKNIKYHKYEQVKKEDLSKEVLDWYNNFDLKAWRKSKKWTGKKICEKMGFARTYDAIYGEFENHKLTNRSNNWLIVKKLYEYINKDKQQELFAQPIDEEPKPVVTNIRVNDVELPKTTWAEMPPVISNGDELKKMKILQEDENGNMVDYKELYEETLKELERYKKLIDLIK